MSEKPFLTISFLYAGVFMNIKFKLILPSIVFLFIGLLFFLAIRTLPITMPPELNNMLMMGLIACAFLFFLSKRMLRYESIELSVVHLKPNKTTFLRLLIGLIIGAIIVGVMLYTVFTLTNLNLNRVESQTMAPFLLAVSAFIPLALMEELLFRGYPFFRLTQTINIRWVLLITAILFALYHYNGTASVSSLLIGPGVWGVTFGVAAYLSKSIAVPLGMHISTNVLQAIFGLKSRYVPMWEVEQSTKIETFIEPTQLGIAMQIVLLVISIIVLEISLYRRKSMHKKVANIHLNMMNEKVLKK